MLPKSGTISASDVNTEYFRSSSTTPISWSTLNTLDKRAPPSSQAVSFSSMYGLHYMPMDMIAFYDARANFGSNNIWLDRSGNNRHLLPRSNVAFTTSNNIPFWRNNHPTLSASNAGFFPVTLAFPDQWCYYFLWFYNSNQPTVNATYPRLTGGDRSDIAIRLGSYASGVNNGAWFTHQAGNLNAWQALAANFNFTSKTISYYLNGSNNVNTRNTGTGWTVKPTEIRIGTAFDVSTEAVRGNFGVIALYNRVLTTTEIQRMYSRLPANIYS